MTDYNGVPVSIETGVMCNFFGTLVTNRDITPIMSEWALGRHEIQLNDEDISIICQALSTTEVDINDIFR